MAKTSTPGLVGDDTSHRLQAVYNGDRYGLEVERLAVGDNFNPEVGFLQRDNFRRTYALARFSPRPRTMPSVRKLTFETSYDYFAGGNGRMETRAVTGRFGAEFQNSDKITMDVARRYELLERPFAIARGVTIPVGGYGFQDVQLETVLGNQRRVSGTVTLTRGSFYNGDKTALSYSSGRVLVTPRISLEPGVSLNWIGLPGGGFTTTLVTTRATFTTSPLSFVSGLVQYNSGNHTVSTNLRLRWEYTPGSELFVVYTDERNTQLRGFPDLTNRAFVVKINRLFRF